MKILIKNLANILTILRMVLSVVLLFLNPLWPSFLIVYTICAFTDVMDGYVARKTHTETRTGAILDSLSDLLFVGIMMIKLFPTLYETLPTYYLYIVFGIAAIKIIGYIVGLCRFHHIVAIHTIMNKMTGVSLFFIPYIVVRDTEDFFYMLICIIATVAAVEELFCQAIMKQEELNVKTVFMLLEKTEEDKETKWQK